LRSYLCLRVDLISLKSRNYQRRKNVVFFTSVVPFSSMTSSNKSFKIVRKCEPYTSQKIVNLTWRYRTKKR